ncbi:hypothetical protein K2173_020446 [Erythroxylum novogranatense]|uniref:Uncharacterized protein n=1 Tax=Erythroxylum novogranatense TaxID=1862640 RepID=A0AAV8TIU7_9ROSI|nr:hypothetical protein K2173_020446 [Erythroxylum novogranatense]
MASAPTPARAHQPPEIPKTRISIPTLPATLAPNKYLFKDPNKYFEPKTFNEFCVAFYTVVTIVSVKHYVREYLLPVDNCFEDHMNFWKFSSANKNSYLVFAITQHHFPEIVEKAERSDIPNIDKKKYLVPADLTVDNLFK